MTPIHIAGVVAGMAFLNVIGDYFLKLASLQPTAIANRYFFAGVSIYALSAFGWVFAMRHMNLAAIGVVYSLSTILLLAALGVFVFRETLTTAEAAGICLAVLSILLMSRFTG